MSSDILSVQVRMKCRLPTHLCTTTGMDRIGNVPLSRWDLEGLWRGSQITKARFGGFLPDVDTFDCSLFSISVPEAELMDPQQRLLLEVGVPPHHFSATLYRAASIQDKFLGLTRLNLVQPLARTSACQGSVNKCHPGFHKS